MGGGRDICWDVKRDLTMHVYISNYLSHSVYMERILPGRFSSRPSKAGQFLSYKQLPLNKKLLALPHTH